IVSKALTAITTSWKKGAERLFGYTGDEVVGKSITILVPPERLSEEPQILSRLQRGERVDHFETIRRRKDGTLLDISLTISPVRDAQGHIIGASKIARDITDRKRAEAAIKELNEQLAAELVAMARMQQLSTRLVQAGDFPVLLEEIVGAAMEITGAAMGDVQLFEDEISNVVAQRGSDTGFSEPSDTIDQASRTAVRRGERVIVKDQAGTRAVISTPLVSRSGQVLGVFSTHYRSPLKPAERDLRM